MSLHIKYFDLYFLFVLPATNCTAHSATVRATGESSGGTKKLSVFDFNKEIIQALCGRN
jgi:hypothetical protein